MEYYQPRKKTMKEYFFEFNETGMSHKNIQDAIKENKHFCREQSSIKLYELTTYIADGITFFINEDEIKGLVNFTFNVDKITIKGLCVPEEYKGNGKILMDAVKSFALNNGVKQIKLTCYGDVVNFYKKQGFLIEEENDVYDSDDEDEVVTSYEMVYNILSKGRKRRRTKRKNKRRIKSKKTK